MVSFFRFPFYYLSFYLTNSFSLFSFHHLMVFYKLDEDRKYTEEMKNITSNTELHDKNLHKHEARFFAILETSKQLKYLCRMVVDPKAICKGGKVRNLYLLCRGEKTREKHTIMNYALLYPPMGSIQPTISVHYTCMRLLYFYLTLF